MVTAGFGVVGVSQRMKVGSLFSGAGGLDIAVEEVFGAETVWHCEIDPAASKVLAYRWPDVPNHGDITATDWGAVEPVDVICAGWPCQPFSLAGKRKGADDERALWPYVAGTVRLVRPRYVVLENVSAVLGPEFQRVANDLAALGYDIAWTCLRASDVGAPHRRERLFVVAHSDEPRPQGAQPAPGHHLPIGGIDANTSGNGRNEGRPEPKGVLRGSDAPLRSDEPLIPTPLSSDAGPRGGTTGFGLRDWSRGIERHLLQTPSVADSVGGHISRSGDRGNEMLLPGQARDMAGARWGNYEPAIRRWERATRPAPPPTELTQRNTHRLSPAFSEWLMGWPKGWVTDLVKSPTLHVAPDIAITRNEALRIIGNGVCPQQASEALRRLALVAQEAV